MNAGTCALAVGIGLAVTSAALGQHAVKHYESVIPWRSGRNTGLIIPVRVNGTNASFLFDTGTGICAISDRFAEKLRLMPQPARRKDGSPVLLPNGRRLQQVRAETVQVGRSAAEDLRFAVHSGEMLKQLVGEPVDGIIGVEFIQDCAVLLDFPRQEIRLIDPGNLNRKELAPLGMEGAFHAPFRDVKSNYEYSMRVRFGPIEADALLDTGAGTTYLRRSLADQLHLLPSTPPETQTTLERTFTLQRAILPRLQVGDTSIEQLAVAYLTEEVPGHPNLLGLDILSRFRVLVDYPAEEIFLKPLTQPSLPEKR